MGEVADMGKREEFIGEAAFGSLLDISKSHQTEEDPAKTQQMLENIVQGIEEGILLLTTDFRIIWANKAFYKQTGYRKDEIIGEHCYRVTHHRNTPCTPPNDTCPILETQKTGRPITALHTHFDNEGKEFFVEVSAYPIKDGQGRIVQFVHLGRDVSERMRADEELKLAYSRLEKAYDELEDIDRLKTDIISNVSHELRTPITISRASMELAREETSKKELARLFSMMEKALDRLNENVEDLVSAAEISSGRHKLDIQEIKLKTLISGILKEYKKEINKRKFKVAINIPNNLPSVRGDPKALGKVFRNILGNAIKFNRDGGEINLSVKEKGDEIEILVSDTGIGIPNDKIDLVFAPLYQVDATSTREYGGMGMGLAVAKSIVSSHGGKIWAKSVLGEGTRLYFTLPLKGEVFF